MKAVITLVANRAGQIIETETGELLSAVLNRSGVHIDMPCAGKGICQKCTVRINGEECLACRTRIEGDARVELDKPDNIKNIAAGNIMAPPENPMFSRYGISVDIGTTTVCASLMDTEGCTDTVTRKNPQTSFGADIISRIEKAISGGLAELAYCIRGALGEMTAELCAHRGIAPEFIDAAVITGNTAMLYLLTEQDPVSLSCAPFQAGRLFGEYMDAKTLGLPVSPDAQVYLPRCASAFVGSDITTAIIASGMCGQDETALLADIGTNGEIALWHAGNLICCSTAAGPAFEGAGITNGVYGISGAIDRVWHDDGQICCSTIDGVAAVGICGSGIVDALAVMLKLGIIDETGAFADGIDCAGLQNDIRITARDVRKIQLAKGSIRAGIETLLECSGVNKSKVKTLYIAGGFGNFVDIKNAAGTGLIPEELADRAKVIGNAAHTGASMILRDKTLASVSEKLAAQARTIALDANPIFTDNYITYMMFK